MAIRGSLDSTPTKGFLGADGAMGGGTGMGSLAGRGGSLIYHYGYPAFGASQPNVVGQWAGDLFGLGAHTSGGNAVDRVSSVSLTPVGAPTYGTTLSGIYSGLSPGCTFDGANQYFHSDAAQATLNLGTSDYVFEAWFKTSDSTGTNEVLFDTLDATDGNGYHVRMNQATPNVIMTLRGSGITNMILTTTALADGNPHKIRISGVRSASATLYLDGVSQGSADISARNGDSIPASAAHIGCRDAVDHGFKFNGSIFEIRMTVGNSTNNSGGPGGG